MALPREPPMPSTMTSSCSSTTFSAPSPGRNAVILRPFLMSCVLTHLRMALFGCLLSTPTFSSTIPRAKGAPWSGSDLMSSLNSRRL